MAILLRQTTVSLLKVIKGLYETTTILLLSICWQSIVVWSSLLLKGERGFSCCLGVEVLKSKFSLVGKLLYLLVMVGNGFSSLCTLYISSLGSVAGTLKRLPYTRLFFSCFGSPISDYKNFCLLGYMTPQRLTLIIRCSVTIQNSTKQP